MLLSSFLWASEEVISAQQTFLAFLLRGVEGGEEFPAEFSENRAFGEELASWENSWSWPAAPDWWKNEVINGNRITVRDIGDRVAYSGIVTRLPRLMRVMGPTKGLDEFLKNLPQRMGATITGNLIKQEDGGDFFFVGDEDSRVSLHFDYTPGLVDQDTMPFMYLSPNGYLLVAEVAGSQLLLSIFSSERISIENAEGFFFRVNENPISRLSLVSNFSRDARAHLLSILEASSLSDSAIGIWGVMDFGLIYIELTKQNGIWGVSKFSSSDLWGVTGPESLPRVLFENP